MTETKVGTAPAAPHSDLLKLSAGARQGEWTVESMKNYGTSEADQFTSYCIECGGHTVLDTLNSDGGWLEQETDSDGDLYVWDEQARRDLAFVAALVNAYRRGEVAYQFAAGGQTVWLPIHAGITGGPWLVGRPGVAPARAFKAQGSWWLHGCGPTSRNPIELGGNHAPTHYKALPLPPA